MRRADELLFASGLAESRSRARALIEGGRVSCEGKTVDKPSRKFPEGSAFEIAGGAPETRYVSRAGLKLEGFLKKFGPDLSGVGILDAGASTGGFTDCALAFGAASSVCVDVGSGQLHPRLAADPRVRNMEGTDIRSLSPASFGGKPFGFVCADLSFISLEKAFASIWGLVAEGGAAVCLVKPQFESSARLARKRRGVLRPEESAAALEKIAAFISGNFPDARIFGTMPSPILGGDGNAEYLVGARKARKREIPAGEKKRAPAG